jgi:hypothetical protein
VIVKLVKKKKESVIAMGQINRGARYRTDKQLHAVRMLDFVRFASFSGRFSAVSAPIFPLGNPIPSKLTKMGKSSKT